MENKLLFKAEHYEVLTESIEGKTLEYRAFEHIPYMENPVDAIQELAIFVPEAYYRGETINGYDLHTAPILIPNTIGGYMPGPSLRPGHNPFNKEVKIESAAGGLLHGYVVVVPGVRGRTMKNAEGDNIGVAPAAICDLKACVRWLKANKDEIPGNTDHIISNGTSAGGAMSSLLGASGNHPDYASYLKVLGACDGDDSIFAASCYCPITNLDHADMAYEWEFYGVNDYHGMKFEPPLPGEDRPQITPVDDWMTDEQVALSKALKPLFSEYLNSLELKDAEGNALVLDENGDGSFKDYVISFVRKEAQRVMNHGEDLTKLDWLTLEDGKVTVIDFDNYVKFRTRMKTTPAFDNVSGETAETMVFGSAKEMNHHFTSFSLEHDKMGWSIADAHQIKMMNPMNYIDDPACSTAKHYRIRHGIVDRDTSLAISAMLNAKLGMAGVDSRLSYAWGMPHAGDYDLDELFAWIDEICNE